jgi:sugar lactone lactonase YvrE
MPSILFALASIFLYAGGLHAEDYSLGPDSQPQAGVPKGTVTKFILAPGKDYPGTPHNCAVYVPAEYDASKPTPFMIFLDGSQALGDSMRVPVVLDNLIAKHDLPAMIAIFVDPGILPVVSDADQNRYNRIYEYDSLTPQFSDFLLSELIPEVAKTYNLSKNPDDRGLSGVSTGAVGAFMAAWNRPDQFHRVLSLIGTYVSMKGADALPALVRKTEPKPIRIFMQDGTADHIVPGEPYGVAFAGSWPINNQVMYEALEFAGYDVKLLMGTDGHSTKHGGAILPDALRWLWRDYPAPVVVHEPAAAELVGRDTSASVFSTIFVDRPWQQIGDSDSQDITSITSDSEGNVYVADPTAGTVGRVGLDGKVSEIAGLPKDTSVLRMGANDRLYSYSQKSRSIVSSSMATGVASDQKTVARFPAKVADEVADFVVARSGMIYYLDGLTPEIHIVDSSGRPQATVLYAPVGTAGGLALSPDQSMLVVTDSVSRYSWSFQIAADGSPINGEPFYRLELPETTTMGWGSRAQGVVEDVNGQVYFATPLGIQVSMQNGRVVEILNMPRPGAQITGLTFAASGDSSWLYLAEHGRLFRRPVKVTGANTWTVVKPPKPTL